MSQSPITLRYKFSKEMPQFISRLEEVSGFLQHTMKERLDKASQVAAAEVRKHTPVDTGKTKNSIYGKTRVSSGLITAVVSSNEPHIEALERGTKPFFPNVRALTPWAVRNGFNVWAVAVGISKRGLPAHRMFQKGEKIAGIALSEAFAGLEDEVTRKLSA